VTPSVEEKLSQCWSPEQIAGRLKRVFPGDASMRISHEAIYLSLFDPRRRKAIDRSLTQRLRTARPMRRPKKARRPTGRGILRDMVPVSARPAEVDSRAIAGHWEGDLMMGTRPSAMATLVERTSRYTVLVALPEDIKAEHRAFTAATGMPVYFYRPRSPWQRGTNENTNGLLRQYLPKNTDLRTFTQDQLDRRSPDRHDRHGVSWSRDHPRCSSPWRAAMGRSAAEPSSGLA
jgi:IS30 family transposase